MPLEIVTIEHSENAEVLTHKAQLVSFPLSLEDQILIGQMKEKLMKIKGVGLAAPQVGVNKQILVYAISEEAKALRNHADEVVPPTVLINPSYSPLKNTELTYDWEACFSVVEKTGKVPRYHHITLRAQTPDGEQIDKEVSGFTARVLQHEIDHLQGILIIDRLTTDCVQGHPKDMMALRFKDFNPKQLEIMKKMIEEREKNVDPHDEGQAQAISYFRNFLNKHD